MRTLHAILPLLLIGTAARPMAAQSHTLTGLWEYETPGALPQAITVDAREGHSLYVALKSGGLAVLAPGRTPTEAPHEIARVPVDRLGGLDVMNLALRGDRLYLALGDHFAAAGSPVGLAVVDVRDPAAPRVLGTWRSPETLGGAAAIVVDGRYAYVAAMRAGVLIFDISTPAHPRQVGRCRPNVDYPRRNPNRLQHPNARGLALVGDRLYVAYDAGGLRVLDVADRTRPGEIGRYVNAGMRGKQQAYNAVVIAGARACVATDYAGLEVLDIARPDAITQIGWWNPWRADAAGNLWFNSPGHTNQMALDARRQIVYLAAGDSELQAVDVSDARHPTLVSHYGRRQDGRGAWGLALDGDTIYLAYIKALVPFRGTWSGIVAVRVR